MDTIPLRAFHGDPAIKVHFIERIRAHRAAEHLVQGVGWEKTSTQTRGCAIGCTLEAYDHARYPIELGLPEWLAQLEDRIFEGLPVALAQAWPELFLEAITPGADVEPVRHQLAIRRMDRLILLQSGQLGKHGEALDAVIQSVIAAMQQVRACHNAELDGTVCDMPVAAWSAARAAAESASAARAAAESASAAPAESAWSAARAAESAWSAARAARAARAAWSAARAAWSARAAWQQEAKDLLELLRECAP
jgi:hypothetical protein